MQCLLNRKSRTRWSGNDGKTIMKGITSFWNWKSQKSPLRRKVHSEYQAGKMKSTPSPITMKLQGFKGQKDKWKKLPERKGEGLPAVAQWLVWWPVSLQGQHRWKAGPVPPKCCKQHQPLPTRGQPSGEFWMLASLGSLRSRDLECSLPLLVLKVQN